MTTDAEPGYTDPVVRRRVRILLFCIVTALVRVSPVAGQAYSRPEAYTTNPLVVEGDRWYRARQEGRIGARAAAGPINKAIAAYEEASRAPGLLEARWKLMRAFYFKGKYTGLDEESRLAVFAKAKKVSDEAIAILGTALEKRGLIGWIEFGPQVLAGHLKDQSDAAPIYFWSAVSWGEWALASGKLDAARTGAADKIRDDALTVIGIDPAFEDGGGYRVLGRLNDQAPWIPFITGWVSRADAVKYMRMAMKENGLNFANRHFLAEALHGGDAKEQAEAVALEEGLVADAPSPTRVVEELTIQEEARQNLAAWRTAS